MAYEQGYVGDPRGRETAVEDAEVYEGPPDDPGITVEGINQGQIGLPSFTEQSDATAAPVSQGPLGQAKLTDKFSFYLEDDQFGVFQFTDAPFSANINVGQGGQTNWGASVSEQAGPFGAKIGILGQGTSGSISPYADLNVNPLPGLNFNVQGQSYPGGYSQVSPSASYMNQFNTPWGPVNYNIGRQGGRTVGGFQVKGDF